MRPRARRVETPPPLDPRDFAADPIAQFRSWYAQAISSAIPQPDAMALATATPGGRPSLRWVLFKGLVRGGFTFFTHYQSRKGRELEENPQAALAFYWQGLGRQVRIEGAVRRVPTGESDAYFASRPLGSRLGAAASPQSAVIRDRGDLEARVTAWRARYPKGNIPRPAEWGGFRLTPELIEFWQQRRNRLHDRLRYVRAGEAWLLERLAP